MFNFISPQEVPGYAGTRNGTWIRHIREFIASNKPAAEYIVTDESIKNVYSGLAQANKRLGWPVVVTMRNSRIFLLKKEDELWKDY